MHRRWKPFNVPHISISSDDQTNENISHDIYNDKDAEYRYYGNIRWFGHANVSFSDLKKNKKKK